MRDIRELNLSSRTKNVLLFEEISTVEALGRHTEVDLLKLPNFGMKALREVRDALDGLGLCLRPSTGFLRGKGVNEQTAKDAEARGARIAYANVARALNLSADALRIAVEAWPDVAAPTPPNAERFMGFYTNILGLMSAGENVDDVTPE